MYAKGIAAIGSVALVIGVFSIGVEHNATLHTDHAQSGVADASSANRPVIEPINRGPKAKPTHDSPLDPVAESETPNSPPSTLASDQGGDSRSTALTILLSLIDARPAIGDPPPSRFGAEPVSIDDNEGRIIEGRRSGTLFQSELGEFAVPTRSEASLAPAAHRSSDRLSVAALPDWFSQLDADGDGQIGLYEWLAGGGSPDDFRRIDRNHDGFLTPDEVRSCLTQTQGRSDVSVRHAAGIVDNLTGESSSRAWLPGAFPTDTQGEWAMRLFTNGGVPIRIPLTNSVAPTTPTVMAMAHSPNDAPPQTPAPNPQAPSSPVAATTPWPVNDGSRPYWALREQQNEARIHQGRANVVFLGDSITDGFQYGVGLPVWNKLFAPLGAVDFAVGGVTTSQVLWQVRAGQVAAVAPKAVVLLIGTNNLGLGQSPADTAAGIAAIVNEIGHQLPQTRILLLGLFPRGQRLANPYRAQIAQVNRLIMRLADGKRVVYLDFGGAFLQHDASIVPPLMPDFLHPSLVGYQVYAAGIWPTLQAVLHGG